MLRVKGFPVYIQRIIYSYLHARSIEFFVADGSRVSHPMISGVPQGSILGPLLWNLTFDEIPGSEVMRGCRVICYADDTLILASADDPREAATLASLQSRSLKELRDLGLQLPLKKLKQSCSEAIDGDSPLMFRYGSRIDES